MSLLPHDINDDEIRIISSADDNAQNNPSNPKIHSGVVAVAVFIACILSVGLTLYFVLRQPDKNNLQKSQAENANLNIAHPPSGADSFANTLNAGANKPFVDINDTIVDGKTFSIFTPTDATPKLHVGADILDDPTASLVVQAADVRGDNGMIVGAYVLQGELLSKGQAKSGFCAIIDGKINIGVAQTTPLLEQALETNGYFFRQYPLVVANQVVENKPRNKSLRKALAELNGKIVVIMSEDHLTFHDFSQCLVDMGVSDAIYLVGSTAYGFAKDAAGHKIEFGERVENAHPNANYIAWY